MVTEFENFSFSKELDLQVFGKTNYGYHNQILGRRDGTFKKIAVVDKTIRPLKKLRSEFYDSVARETLLQNEFIKFNSV